MRTPVTARSAPQPTPAVTELLAAWGGGDARALDALIPLLYDELRTQARRALRREGKGHTLQPTALVHEAWLRLDGQHDARWESRSQFFAVAAQMMRRVLVDHARTRRALKRGGAPVQVTLDEAISRSLPQDIDVLALNEALTRLAAFDGRKSQVAELRFFSGLSLEETGHVLDISVATVEREWQAARAWLYAALK